jgi:hypothetical protein
MEASYVQDSGVGAWLPGVHFETEVPGSNPSRYMYDL